MGNVILHMVENIPCSGFAIRNIFNHVYWTILMNLYQTVILHSFNDFLLQLC